MKKYLLATLLMALAVGMLSCNSLTTGTITLTYPIDEANVSEDIISMRIIDLNDEEDYQEHRDHIESVDQIAIVAWVYNDGDNTASAVIYADTIDTWTSVEEVEANSTLIFEPTIEVPANDSLLIDWADGLAYMQGTDFLTDLIMNEGVITLYIIGVGTPPYAVRVLGEVTITVTVRL